MRDNRFRKHNHLRKSSEFRRVFQKGRKVVTATLVFHVLATDLAESRVGLAVSRKVGNAVKRNLVKRRVKEAFRMQIGAFPRSYDIVVYPRKGVLEKGFVDYTRAFDTLLKIISRDKNKPAPSRSL